LQNGKYCISNFKENCTMKCLQKREFEKVHYAKFAIKRISNSRILQNGKYCISNFGKSAQCKKENFQFSNLAEQEFPILNLAKL